MSGIIVYGKSEIEKPKFSVLDMQHVLNEKRNVEYELADAVEERDELRERVKWLQDHINKREG
jgi:hypothetical protein